MSFGSSGSMVKASVSRAEENQTGSSRLARMIWPFGPGCSSDVHAAIVADRLRRQLVRGRGRLAAFLSLQPASASAPTNRTRNADAILIALSSKTRSAASASGTKRPGCERREEHGRAQRGVLGDAGHARERADVRGAGQVEQAVDVGRVEQQQRVQDAARHDPALVDDEERRAAPCRRSGRRAARCRWRCRRPCRARATSALTR